MHHRICDKVVLRGLRFFGKHGVLEAERKLGQIFQVDVTISADLRRAGATDELRHTVDYARVFHIVKSAVEATPPKRLVETVAENIALQVLDDQCAADDVTVKIVKPQVALPGQLSEVGIQIFRTRADVDDSNGTAL